MNRRGHTGTIMLVIGAFFLVVFALYIMLSNNTDLSLIKAELRSASDYSAASHSLLIKEFRDIINKSIDEAKSSVDFEMSLNESLKKYANEKRSSGLGNNLYAKIVLGEYSLVLKEGKYEIVVSDVSENYNMNNNEVSYSYSLNVVFDKDKVISIEQIMN